MYAAEYEELLHNNLSENIFKNHRINIKNSEDNWTISDYLYHHFRMKIGEKMTFISCYKNEAPKILKDNSFIMLLYRI